MLALRPLLLCGLIAWTLLPCIATAAAGDGRLLATGGAGQIEGSAGGALVPWAVLAGYSTPGQWDGSLTLSSLRTADLDLQVVTAAAGWSDRLEFSVARQHLELPALTLEQTIVAAKLRLAGDLVYGDVPQISLGVQHKQAGSFATARALGAADRSGSDAYLAVSRLFLDGPGHRNWLVNATVRRSSAIQTGLLGFADATRWNAELAAAVLLDPHWAIGAEYRSKPDLLPGVREDDWWDVFAGWFPNKQFSVVAGYADLGVLPALPAQRGVYLSVQWNPQR